MLTLITKWISKTSRNIDGPKTTSSISARRRNHNQQVCSLQIFPNPASNYIIAEYNIEGKIVGKNELLLTVISSNASAVQSEFIKKPRDQVLIITNDFKPGSYFCLLKAGKKVMAVQKFTIVQ
jgi:hypothetical protein